MSLQAQRAFSIHDPIVDEAIESGRKSREWHDNSDDTVAVNEFEQSKLQRTKKGSFTALEEKVASFNPATQGIARKLKQGILTVRAGKFIPTNHPLIDALTNLTFKRLDSDTSDEDESHVAPPYYKPVDEHQSSVDVKVTNNDIITTGDDEHKEVTRTNDLPAC